MVAALRGVRKYHEGVHISFLLKKIQGINLLDFSFIQNFILYISLIWDYLELRGHYCVILSLAGGRAFFLCKGEVPSSLKLVERVGAPNLYDSFVPPSWAFF